MLSRDCQPRGMLPLLEDVTRKPATNGGAGGGAGSGVGVLVATGGVLVTTSGGVVQAAMKRSCSPLHLPLDSREYKCYYPNAPSPSQGKVRTEYTN